MSSPPQNVILIIGLGNPGTRYSATRHNAGSLVADRLARLLKLRFRYSLRNFAWIAKDDGMVLAKPDSYMNESGPVVARLSRRFGAAALLVVSDDLDLPLGSIRFRTKGAAGGHRGLASIISALGTSAFPRLKIGIGRPAGKAEVTNYVLSAPPPEERELWEAGLDRAAEFLQTAVTHGIERAAGSL